MHKPVSNLHSFQSECEKNARDEKMIASILQIWRKQNKPKKAEVSATRKAQIHTEEEILKFSLRELL